MTQRTTEELLEDAEHMTTLLAVPHFFPLFKGDEMYPHLRALIAELAAKLKGREWQPIEKTLPENTVLVFSETHGYQTDSWNSLHTQIPGDMRFGIPNVTHWQPLPQPPKQDE